MDPLHAAFRRSQRPVCRLWQRGNCTLSSIQCEFRHAEVDSQAGPSLGEAFAPQQRIPDSRWMSRGEQARREPLQELVFPASSTSIWKMDDPRVVLHPSAWDVEADREWNPEWDDFEELQARVGKCSWSIHDCGKLTVYRRSYVHGPRFQRLGL